MTDFWNKKYDQSAFLYGREPNVFFRGVLQTLSTGKILLAAEGEGRNALYAARKGWEVYAFDSSEVAKRKAEELFRPYGLTIHYAVKSYDEVAYPVEFFDVVACIFAHSPTRRANHRKLLSFLKPGGHLILEGFAKTQITLSSGGPDKVELLFSEEELRQDFNACRQLDIRQEEINIQEGTGHRGRASLIRLTGIK